jgi:hypothetical protein
MDRFERLTSDYLDGDLSEGQVAQLEKILQADPAALDYFVVNSFIHFQMLDWLDQQHSPDRGVQAGDREHSFADNANWPVTRADRSSQSDFDCFPEERRGHSAVLRRRVVSWAGLAAALLIAASISVVAYVMAARPVLVGQMTDATGCRWAASQPDIPVGTFLQEGQSLDLIQGRAVITFASGAKVLLEGPASLRLDSPNEARLFNGRLAAKVPRQAVGFTVTSSLARFVDLGTAFTLNLDAEKSFVIHIFEGLVEFRLDERFGKAARQPVKAAEIHAFSFDVNSDDVTPVEFEAGKQMPF